MKLIEKLSRTRPTHTFKRLSLFLTHDAPWTITVSRKVFGGPIHVTFAEEVNPGDIWIFQSANVQSIMGLYEISWRCLSTPKNKTAIEPWLISRLELEIPETLTEQTRLFDKMRESHNFSCTNQE